MIVTMVVRFKTLHITNIIWIDAKNERAVEKSHVMERQCYIRFNT